MLSEVEWLSVSTIGNNPKNGLLPATIGGVERPHRPSPTSPRMIPSFSPYFGPSHPIAMPLVRKGG